MLENRFVSPQEIDQEQAKHFEAQKMSVRAHEDSLAGWVRSMWTVARDYRRPFTIRFQDCMERRAGIYSADMQNKIQQTRSSDIYMRLTSAKCKAAKTWLSDLFEPAGDRPFSLEPANSPELNPELKMKLIDEAMAVMRESNVTEQQALKAVDNHERRLEDELRQKAEVMAEKMSDRIEDILHEAGWKHEFDDFLDDLATYPVAIMAGLEYRKEKEQQWTQDQSGRWVNKYSDKIKPKIRRVSPFRFYPSPSVNKSLRGHWCIEHLSYTRQDLVSMKKMPGYNARGIAMALTQYSITGLQEWLWEDEEQDIINYTRFDQTKETIDALKWSGSVSGSRLKDFGLTGLKDQEEYQAEIEIVGGFVIRASLDIDQDGSPGYYFSHWSSLPGSFYGDALPELMDDAQDMCNSAARALNDNMAMSSGPMVWLDVSKIASQDLATAHHIYPRKVWRANPKGPQNEIKSANAAVQFFQPQSNATELLKIFDHYSAIADEVTGLPKFAYGSDQGSGAAKTASGLSMLMNASSKTIKHPVRSVDIDLITPLVKKIYDHEMMYGEDESIKGDLMIKARGSQSLIHKEQQALRQTEFMQMTTNPVDMELIGKEGRLEMLRSTAKAIEMPVDRVMPSREELKANLEQMQAQQQQLQKQQAQQQQLPQQQAA